jgi:NAD(P)-dependent dehydrogenase (short-subunit alcohol dehydrogenase family)
MANTKRNERAVLITGTSSGIGRHTALLLDARGYRVFAGVRRAADAQSLASAASSRLTPLILDVTRPDEISAALATINQEMGPRGLSALINNAGFNYNTAFGCTDEAKARALMETNLFGVSALSQAALPLLRRSVAHSGNTAKLVNLGSIGSLIGIPWEAYYHAAKFAVIGLSESIRNEVFAQGVRVSVICPGGIKTPFIAKTGDSIATARAGFSPEAEQLYGKGLSTLAGLTGRVDRLGSPPEAVARAIAGVLARRNPPFRVLVGTDARLLYSLRTVLPASWFHALLRSQFGC